MGTETVIDAFCKLQMKLHRVACRILKDEMEAEDAVQDTFCNLWNSALPDSADEARFRLFAILRNVCINKLKRKRAVSGDCYPDIPVEADQYEETERIKSLVLSVLTDTQREIYVLSVFEELEYEEISRRLGMSVDSVRMHMSRARRKVREQYKKLSE